MNRAPTPQREVLNKKRRMLLMLGATGAAAFVAGKLFGGTVGRFLGMPSDVEKITEFTNFTFKETGEEMALYDKSGNAIFIVEKH